MSVATTPARISATTIWGRCEAASTTSSTVGRVGDRASQRERRAALEVHQVGGRDDAHRRRRPRRRPAGGGCRASSMSIIASTASRSGGKVSAGAVISSAHRGVAGAAAGEQLGAQVGVGDDPERRRRGARARTRRRPRPSAARPPRPSASGVQSTAGRCTSAPRWAVRWSAWAWATWPVRTSRSRSELATNSTPVGLPSRRRATSASSSRQTVASRARTSNAGAMPDSSDGCPNASPGSSTSITSSSCTSSTEPERTTYRWRAGVPSSTSTRSPSAYARSTIAAAASLELVLGQRVERREAAQECGGAVCHDRPDRRAAASPGTVPCSRRSPTPGKTRIEPVASPSRAPTPSGRR